MISPTCVDFILESLYNLLEDSSIPSDMKDESVELLIVEIENLKIYMSCLAKWNDSSFGMDKNFGFVEESQIESTLEEAERNFRMSECDFTDFIILGLASELLEKIQQCKPKIKEDCLNFLDCSFQCEFTMEELPEFMESISASLHNLLIFKVDMMLDVKVQIEYLEGNLDLFKEIFEFTAKWCCSHENLKDFKIHIQAWACNAACLSLLYWVLDVKKENMAPRMDVILSDLQRKISPSTPEVMRMYLAVLKDSSADANPMVGKLVLKFVEFLKDNFLVDPEKDVIQVLFIELIFLITFLMDRPEPEMYAEEGKLILTQANAVINDVASLISALCAGEIKEGIAEERNFLLLDFLEKANAIKAKVRKLYAHLFLDPSSFNLPRINVFGFIGSFSEKLKEFSNHFPKHQIVMLQKELLFLKESNLKEFSILELQNKHKDIKDLWTRIVDVAYHAERAVSSFIYMNKSLWHDILSLCDVIEEIKLIKGEGKRIQDQHMCDIRALNSETTSYPLLPLQANLVGKVVGFKHEVEEIINRLRSGSPELDIVSIVGMPGLGKTTLAKKVYTDPSVRYHFNKIAWCTVSQTFYIRRILLDILTDVTVWNDDFYKMAEEDLAQKLQKCLRGQKYLIVMDDIWDVSAWNALKMSFPDDRNGSRIMLTSRIHDVAVEAKPGCSPFPLNPLSEEESWELLENHIFDQDSCPPNFVKIGKQIARNCKGLPLTVVLTAALLKDKIECMDWWKQVGERVESSIAKEGCTDILELSYKHLPEYLKPCFLYFGSLPEDSEIGVKRLTQLWISEGFVQKHERKSSEVVAKEYLMDFVARSLVIVTKVSSTGGIKACCVHDLFHDFCLTKSEEEKIFKVINENEVSYHPIPMAASYAHYRFSIQTESWGAFLEHIPPAPFVHSLLLFPKSDGSFYGSFDYIPYHAFTNLKFLQVLNLEFSMSAGEFPEAITALVLLRYLAIPCASGAIPPSIKRLQNLETFRVFCYNSLLLPVAMWEIQKLRHVGVKSNLHFCDDMPPLENVQTFSSPVLLYGEEVEMLLRMVPKVRKLKFDLLFDSGNGMDSNQILKLDFLNHLESLNVTHSDYSIDTKLHSCAFYFPSTLKKLNLEDFELPWTEISAISKLPNLEVLKLHNSFCGKTWNVEDEEFLMLKFLKLNCLDIQNLNASENSFSCLERLVVEYCRNLEEIPSRFGSISTLKMIQIKDCRSTLDMSVRRIQEEQVELGNELLEVLISTAA